MITPGTFPLIISHRITFPDLPNFTRFPYEHRNSTSEYASTSHHSKTIQSFFFFLSGNVWRLFWTKLAKNGTFGLLRLTTQGEIEHFTNNVNYR